MNGLWEELGMSVICMRSLNCQIIILYISTFFSLIVFLSDLGNELFVFKIIHI